MLSVLLPVYILIMLPSLLHAANKSNERFSLSSVLTPVYV